MADSPRRKTPHSFRSRRRREGVGAPHPRHREGTAQKGFEGVGVSLPGRVDLSSHHLVFAPNLGWPLTDLKSPLERGPASKWNSKPPMRALYPKCGSIPRSFAIWWPSLFRKE